MKRFYGAVVLSLLAVGAAGSAANAADVTAVLDTNSAYVWRGLTFNDGFVLQPSLDVVKDGFDVNVWGNFDLDDYDGAVESGNFSEIDLSASYTHSFGPVDASLGLIEYTFPNGAHGTTEVFGGLSMDVGAGFSINTKVYYDFDQVDDFYATVGAGYGYEINKETSLSLSGSVGYAGEDMAAFYAGGTDGGFFNYLLTASIKYMVTDALGVGASINYSDSLDSDVLPDDAVDTTVFGGVTISYAF